MSKYRTRSVTTYNEDQNNIWFSFNQPTAGWRSKREYLGIDAAGFQMPDVFDAHLTESKH